MDHVNNWLDDICRRLPMVEQCAKYWLCRATATELDGADYHDVVGVFEEAAEAGAQVRGSGTQTYYGQYHCNLSHLLQCEFSIKSYDNLIS